MRSALLLALFAVIGAVGCQKTPPAPPAPAIAAAWQARCGNCHVRVEPHSRTRAELEAAFQRHQSRARLSPEEWKQLEDFLASDVRAQDGTASMARR